MLSLFKKPHIYLIISKNQMEVKFIEKNIVVKRNAIKPFSTDNSIFANFKNAYELLINILDEFEDSKFLKKSKKILVQPTEKVTQVESVTLLDLARHSGGIIVKITEQKNKLLDHEVLKILNS